MERLVERAPTADQIGMGVVESGCLAVEIDEHDAAPDMGAQFDQTQGVAVDLRMRVLPRPTDMRRGDEPAIEAVAPGMIGAADRAADRAGPVDQDHAAVAADILEHADRTRPVAQHQHRDTGIIDRPGIARRRNIVGEGDPGPLAEQQRVAFGRPCGGIGVMGVGQPPRRGDIAQDRRKILGHRQPPSVRRAKAAAGAVP
jgi:hypothetical protein